MKRIWIYLLVCLLLGGCQIVWGGDFYPPIASATEARAGKVELATDAETVTGSATGVVTTPANITARLAAPGTIGGTTPAPGVYSDSYTNTRTDNPEIIRTYEATSDGDNYGAVQAPPKGTGYTQNNVVYLPDSGVTGARPPVLIARLRTAGGQNLTTAATVDVNGSTIVIPASTFIVGKQLRWVVYGRIAGTTNTKTITLTEGTHTLAVVAAAAIVGSFKAEFCFSEVTALTAQQMYANMIIGAAVAYPIIATNVENDLAMNAQATIKLTMTLANAADDIWIDGVDIYFEQF
jgi:hypothetical protein